MVISIFRSFELAVNFLIDITSDTGKFNFCLRMHDPFVTNPESELQCYNANVNISICS